MLAAMRENKGVGLAAPQVGSTGRSSSRISATGRWPSLTPRSSKKSGGDVIEEGCLSIPGVTVMVRRPERIVVRYIDENNQPHEKFYEEMMARVIQHEMDHLDGKLIVDYAGIKEKIKLRAQLKELERKTEGEGIMACLLEDNTEAAVTPLPSWFKQDLPDVAKVREMKDSFRQAGLHTVCESALCPNLGKCWGRGVATFMILGEICTRACRFCGVKTGRPMAVDPQEPRQVASAVQRLNLRYVVVTSVSRDDLADEGSGQFVRTIHAIRSLMPQTRIEVLILIFPTNRNALSNLWRHARR